MWPVKLKSPDICRGLESPSEVRIAQVDLTNGLHMREYLAESRLLKMRHVEHRLLRQVEHLPVRHEPEEEIWVAHIETSEEFEHGLHVTIGLLLSDPRIDHIHERAQTFEFLREVTFIERHFAFLIRLEDECGDSLHHPFTLVFTEHSHEYLEFSRDGIVHTTHVIVVREEVGDFVRIADHPRLLRHAVMSFRPTVAHHALERLTSEIEASALALDFLCDDDTHHFVAKLLSPHRICDKTLSLMAKWPMTHVMSESDGASELLIEPEYARDTDGYRHDFHRMRQAIPDELVYRSRRYLRLLTKETKGF